MIASGERQELKLLFPEADVGALRSILRRTCDPIRYAGPVSRVLSIYFDDWRLSACRANLDGVGIRHKTRLRWYDADEPAGPAFFETKSRRHDVTGKERTPLEGGSLPFRDGLRAVHAALLRLVPAGSQAHLGQDMDAVALVEYDREHFALRTGDARLTLDTNLRFYPLIGRKVLSRRFVERLPGAALIEAKTPVGATNALARALEPLRARPSRFSKYVEACRRLGYARGL